MNNDLVNEISDYRSSKLYHYTHGQINLAVRNAIEALSPGAMMGLQGLSAEDDGVTKTLWAQALSAAEMDGSLTFPQFRNSGETIPPDAEPVSFEIAVKVVAGRVARSILIVNGLVSGFGPGPGEDWETL